MTSALEKLGLKVGTITRPRLIVPLVEASEAKLLAAAKQAVESPADWVEWRVDRFEQCRDNDRVIHCARKIREVLAGRPLLFTIRTSHEGGEWKPSSEEYRDLIADACRAQVIDLVDVQYQNPEAKRCFKAAKIHQIPVLASSHDCKLTPDNTELHDRLNAMAAMGADICKIAVVPRSTEDVLRLLELTRVWTQGNRIPLITMAMGPLGVISRVGGHIFGSCATFGSLGDAISAPGQLPIEQLEQIVGLLSQDLPDGVKYSEKTGWQGMFFDVPCEGC